MVSLLKVKHFNRAGKDRATVVPASQKELLLLPISAPDMAHTPNLPRLTTGLLNTDHRREHANALSRPANLAILNAIAYVPRQNVPIFVTR
ncbi:MAG: hypothetical protein QMD17_10075 [Rhodocyclaceae bacterium]|nr:hypothetical protein [Rhodocyclaceae bacterium]